MRPTTLSNTIKALYPLRRTLWIQSKPGTGKSSIAKQTAKELDAHYIELHGPTMLVEDFGIPVPDTDKGTFRYMMPSWFPCANSEYDDGKPVILNFDDAAQMGADLQKVLANIIQARNLHGIPLLPTVMIVATGNRQSDRAGANRLLSHLANRISIVELEVHLDDTCAWASANDVRPEVVTYWRFRPDALCDFDPQRESNPTPRSWVEGVSPILGNVPPEAEYELVTGALGEGEASSFMGFLRIFRKLPNPDSVLLHPDTADVPTDPATCYALSGALAHRATTANMERFVTYISRMSGDYSAVSMSMAVRRDPSLANTQAFTKWAVAHQDVLF
jgi:hypothetical protein